jgi:hypothetical protein
MTGYQSKKAAAQDKLAQPEQEPDGRRATQERQWIWLSDADIAEVVDTTCQYTGGYEEYLIKKAERKIRSMNNGT